MERPPGRFDPKVSWDSDRDDILEDFYKPALMHCRRYDRLAGYFSSSSFVLTVRETIDFIERGGVMRLVTSASLSRQDAETLENSVDGGLAAVAEEFNRQLDGSDELATNCAKILGWMLASRSSGAPQLEIKIAVPKSGGTFHPKLGIFEMEDGGAVSFTGSVNETGSAWRENIESFKVFKSWADDTNRASIRHDREDFEKYYGDRAPSAAVYDLPEAVRSRLLRIRPQSTKEFEEVVRRVKERFGSIRRSIRLHEHQAGAADSWEEGGRRGILEMATGTGKTYTALECAGRLQAVEERLVVVIAAPKKHIVEQWKESVVEWNERPPGGRRLSGRPVDAYSDNAQWKRDLRKAARRFNDRDFDGRHTTDYLVVYTTHETLSSEDFARDVGAMEGEVMLVVDEVHGAGAEQASAGLRGGYKYRLGLSATPVRRHDEEGSRKILDYFGGVSYQFGIKEAIERRILVQYEYHPIFVEFTPEEQLEYEELTAKIARQIYASRRGRDPEEPEEFPNKFAVERAKLIGRAQQKLARMEGLLEERGNRLRNTLVYCEGREQLDQVVRILSARNISSQRITWENPTAERLDIIQMMKDRHLECVTAINCLDEGVDIPSVQTAIILASTGNPRQYIQRRGRVLRRSDKTDKTHAVIYDFTVKTKAAEDAELARYERKLVARELLRVKDFADLAVNRAKVMAEVGEVAAAYDVEIGHLTEEYVNLL